MTKISELAAAAALSGTELVPVVQGGITERTTAQAIANLAPSGTSVAVVRKASDTSKTSDNTLAADPHLVFAIGATEVWVLDFTIYYDGGTTGDISFNMSGPAGATGKQVFWALHAGISSDINSVRVRGGALGWSGLAFGAAGTGTVLVAKGHVLVAGGGTAGDVSLLWAQAVSNGTATTVFADSFIVATKVA